jgi:hypothetical protein
MSMQDNSQNKWKTCLEDPENFPGETVPHKNEIWEKLYQRLHNKPRRKLLAWYWAAACLLILVSASVLVFQNGKKQQPASSIVPATVQNQVPPATENVLSKDQKKRNEILLQSKQKAQTVIRAQKNSITVTIPSVGHDLTDSILNQLPELVITSNVINDASTNPITVVTPAKKKLRVVHLNEIGQPVEEPTVNNRFAEKHGLGWRIINGENYNPVYGSSTNNGLILTKPRSTSN